MITSYILYEGRLRKNPILKDAFTAGVPLGEGDKLRVRFFDRKSRKPIYLNCTLRLSKDYVYYLESELGLHYRIDNGLYAEFIE